MLFSLSAGTIGLKTEFDLAEFVVKPKCVLCVGANLFGVELILQHEDGKCKQPNCINQRHLTRKIIQLANLTDFLQHILNIPYAWESDELDQQGCNALTWRDLQFISQCSKDRIRYRNIWKLVQSLIETPLPLLFLFHQNNITQHLYHLNPLPHTSSNLITSHLITCPTLYITKLYEMRMAAK